MKLNHTFTYAKQNYNEIMQKNKIKLFPSPTEKHSLKYFLTASSGATKFQGFLAEMVVDHLQGGYCDSNGARPRDEWAERIVKDDPKELEYSIDVCVHYIYTYKAHVENLKKQFNQSEGINNFMSIIHFYVAVGRRYMNKSKAVLKPL